MRGTRWATPGVRRAVGCAVFALLAWAPAAGATTTLTSDGATAIATGSAEPDAITVNIIPNPDPVAAFPVTLEVTDPGGVSVQGLCSQGPTPSVGLCPVEMDAEVRGDAGDDTIVSIAPALEFSLLFLNGDDGNDRIRGSEASDLIFGGRGDDLLDGSGGDDVLGGGAGFPETGFDAGSDSVYGGPGGDELSDDDADGLIGPDTLSGGSCPASDDAEFCSAPAPENPGDADTVFYSSRTAGLVLDLGSAAPGQGEPGEDDTVLSVEDALTGDGPDLVKGNADVNFISSGGGDDRVEVQGDGANVDRVFCKDGTDTVVADVADFTELDCEFSVVDGVSGGGGGPVGGTGGSSGGGGGAAKAGPAASVGKALKATITGARSAGRVRVAANGTLILSRHEVRCPAGGVPCVVRTSLSGVLSTGARRKRTAMLGGSAYALAAGKRGAVKLRLTKKGLRQLRRSKTVNGTVTITVTKAGIVSTKKVKVTLKPRRKKR
jgi:hypothetical protein